jgi:hypothetical protein
MELEAGPLRFRLEAAMRPQEAPAPQTPDASAPGEAAPGEANPGEEQLELSPTKVSELEKKREYMLRRQAWIKAGKRGPPPEPPA